jgi:methyl-accepting chemotaxis protein
MKLNKLSINIRLVPSICTVSCVSLSAVLIGGTYNAQHKQASMADQGVSTSSGQLGTSLRGAAQNLRNVSVGGIGDQVTDTVRAIAQVPGDIVDAIGSAGGYELQSKIANLRNAVDVARGGEQRLRFGEAAAELRNLTQRSAETLREIADMLER